MVFNSTVLMRFLNPMRAWSACSGYRQPVVVAAPSVELSMTTSWGFLTPSVKAGMTQYDRI